MDGPASPLPRKVGEKGQVQIPPELALALAIKGGDYVWIGENPERPGTLVLIPDPAWREIVRKGWISAG